MLLEKSKLKVKLAEQQVQAARNNNKKGIQKQLVSFQLSEGMIIIQPPPPSQQHLNNADHVVREQTLRPTNQPPTGVVSPVSKVSFQPGPFSSVFLPQLLSMSTVVFSGVGRKEENQ